MLNTGKWKRGPKGDSRCHTISNLVQMRISRWEKKIGGLRKIIIIQNGMHLSSSECWRKTSWKLTSESMIYWTRTKVTSAILIATVLPRPFTQPCVGSGCWRWRGILLRMVNQQAGSYCNIICYEKSIFYNNHLFTHYCSCAAVHQPRHDRIRSEKKQP